MDICGNTVNTTIEEETSPQRGKNPVVESHLQRLALHYGTESIYDNLTSQIPLQKERPTNKPPNTSLNPGVALAWKAKR